MFRWYRHRIAHRAGPYGGRRVRIGEEPVTTEVSHLGGNAPLERGARTVSIGLPVWNGEAFLARAIDSLAAQTFTDWELIISDNASTDRTAEICAARASADPRIRYSRNGENVGLQANTQRVLDLAMGRYFMWASHDDEWDETYLARMVEVLAREPSVVLAGCDAASIDAQGRHRTRYDNHVVFGGGSLYERARRFIAADPQGGHSTLIFALMRTDVVKRLGLARFDQVRQHNRGKYAWDKRALFRLLFEGEFYVTSDVLFFHRDVIPQRPRPAWWSLSRQYGRFRRSVDHSRDVHEYFSFLRKVIGKSPLARQDQRSLRRFTYSQEARHIVRYYWANLRNKVAT